MKLHAFAIATLFAFAAPTAGAVEIDVYLLAGQSNAAGRADQSNVGSDPAGIGSTAADLTNLAVELWYSNPLNGAVPNTPNAWTTLRPAAQFAGAGNFGPEIGLGNRLLELNPTRNIAIIKHAAGSTNLYSHWDVDAAGGPNQWDTFVTTVHAGLQAIIDRGDTPIIRGMAWQQGENDSSTFNSSQPNGDAYGQNLQDLILEARIEFNAPDMTFVYGTVLQGLAPGPNFEFKDEVFAGQQTVDQDSGDSLATSGAFLIDATDLTTNFNSDFIHLDYVGQLALGERFANQFGTAVPEPSTLLLLALGVFALLLSKRRT